MSAARLQAFSSASDRYVPWSERNPVLATQFSLPALTGPHKRLALGPPRLPSPERVRPASSAKQALHAEALQRRAQGGRALVNRDYTKCAKQPDPQRLAGPRLRCTSLFRTSEV